MQQYRIQRLGPGFAVVWEENGKRRRYRLGAQSRAEAEAEARDVILRQCSRERAFTIRDLWEAYRAANNHKVIANSMIYTGRSVLPSFGALRPDQVQLEDSRAYIAACRAAGIQDGTIWTRLNHLRICLGWAVKMNMIERAPYIERPPQPKPRERYLSRAEIKKLLAAPSEPHIRLAIVLMLTTAARVTAVLELTWDRVDLERRQIDLRTGSTTRKGRAVVPINDTLIDALNQARSAALSDHVIEWAGRRVASIKKGFKRTVERAELRDVTPHVLRHTSAVHMAEAGVPMEEISQYLGHSNTSITASTYARFSPQHLRKAAGALEFGTL